MTIKKFKECIYLKIFERFKSENNSEMLAAITVNALRYLDSEQKYKLALDMGVRTNFALRDKLIYELQEYNKPYHDN